MSDVLVRIKRAVLSGRFEFSRKAAEEMDADNLTRLDVAESVLNAVAIYKTIRSVSRFRGHRHETLHVIQSTNLMGVPICTKGELVAEAGIETYYFWCRRNEPNESSNHDRLEDLPNMRKPANTTGAKNCHPKESWQAVHCSATDFSRMPEVRRTGIQPRGHGEDRGAPTQARQGGRVIASLASSRVRILDIEPLCGL